LDIEVSQGEGVEKTSKVLSWGTAWVMVLSYNHKIMEKKKTLGQKCCILF
jgi:hypothetical protein